MGSPAAWGSGSEKVRGHGHWGHSWGPLTGCLTCVARSCFSCRWTYMHLQHSYTEEAQFGGSCVWAQGNFQNPSGHGHEGTPDKGEWHTGARIRVSVGCSTGVQKFKAMSQTWKSWQILFYCNVFFFFFPSLATLWHTEFPSQGLNPSSSCNLPCSWGNAGSFNLTHHTRSTGIELASWGYRDTSDHIVPERELLLQCFKDQN